MQLWPTRLFIASLTTLSLTTATAAAFARAEDEGGSEDVAPPRAVEAGHAPYPEAAHGDAEVVVIVVVEEDGHVSDVEIARGDAPFADAVVAAARQWTFEPARSRSSKGGPVRARIRPSCGSNLAFAKHGRLGCVAAVSDGRAFGGEISLRRSLGKRVGGSLSYTLSRSERRDDVPSGFDRPHVLSAVLSAELGGGFVVGGRISAYSGHPYTRMRLVHDGVEYPIGEINGERLEAFYRLDLRIEKRFRLGRHVTGAVILEGLNVLARKEALGMDCGPDRDGCSTERIGPLTIPNASLELAF